MIPKNVRARLEFFPGFGFRELGITVLGLGIGAIISFLIYLITNHVFSFLFAVIGCTFGFLLSKPEPHTGKSPLSLIKDIRQYNSKPKRYYYRFGEGRNKNGGL